MRESAAGPVESKLSWNPVDDLGMQVDDPSDTDMPIDDVNSLLDLQVNANTVNAVIQRYRQQFSTLLPSLGLSSRANLPVVVNEHSRSPARVAFLLNWAPSGKCSSGIEGDICISNPCIDWAVFGQFRDIFGGAHQHPAIVTDIWPVTIEKHLMHAGRAAGKALKKELQVRMTEAEATRTIATFQKLTVNMLRAADQALLHQTGERLTLVTFGGDARKFAAVQLGSWGSAFQYSAIHPDSWFENQHLKETDPKDILAIVRGLQRGFLYLRRFPSITFKEDKLAASDTARLAVLRIWNAGSGADKSLYTSSIQGKDEFVDHIRKLKSEAASASYAGGEARKNGVINDRSTVVRLCWSSVL